MQRDARAFFATVPCAPAVRECSGCGNVYVAGSGDGSLSAGGLQVSYGPCCWEGLLVRTYDAAPWAAGPVEVQR